MQLQKLPMLKGNCGQCRQVAGRRGHGCPEPVVHVVGSRLQLVQISQVGGQGVCRVQRHRSHNPAGRRHLVHRYLRRRRRLTISGAQVCCSQATTPNSLNDDWKLDTTTTTTYYTHLKEKGKRRQVRKREREIVRRVQERES